MQLRRRFKAVTAWLKKPTATKKTSTKELKRTALTDAEMAQLSALDKNEPLIGKTETPELVEFSLTWQGDGGMKNVLLLGATGTAGSALEVLADTECHLTLFARYAKDEIPDEIDGDDNLDNEPAQIPNRKATDVVEASSLNYTVLRPGYLSEGDEDDAVLTVKGEAAKGYTTSIPSLVKFAVRLILDDRLYSRRSVSITRNAVNG